MSYGKTPENNRSNEDHAREQAYREYLSLRENRSDRGSYVKDDTLYGSYFSRSDQNRRSSIEDTPYGASEMRRKKP